MRAWVDRHGHNHYFLIENAWLCEQVSFAYENKSSLEFNKLFSFLFLYSPFFLTISLVIEHDIILFRIFFIFLLFSFMHAMYFGVKNSALGKLMFCIINII